MTIYVPSQGPSAWQALLADPKKHWVSGYSARALAHCWEEADGVPSEIDELLGGLTELLFATPEYKVPMPGVGKASQCDVFALVRQRGELKAVTIEGKVDESFDEPIAQWLAKGGTNRRMRLDAIAGLLGRSASTPGHLYYQLFHRTAAAILEARRFNANGAAMLVHSFSTTDRWFDAFASFADYLGAPSSIGSAATVILSDGMPLTIGWAKGAPRHLAS
jgi:hypothetical protein